MSTESRRCWWRWSSSHVRWWSVSLTLGYESIGSTVHGSGEEKKERRVERVGRKGNR